MSSYKILVFVPIWKRPEITEICLKGIKRLSKYKPHKYKIKAVAVVSEHWAKKMCTQYDVKWVYADNEPLGAKLNAGLDYCMGFPFDYLMTLGSDDLIDDKLLDLYEPYFKQGLELFGTDKICFVQGKKAKIVSYSLTIAGAGRMIKREALERICMNNVKVEYLCGLGDENNSYMAGDTQWIKKYIAVRLERKKIVRILTPTMTNLWQDERQNALSHNSNMKLITGGASNKCMDISEPLIVDIKSEVNIWGYDYIEGKDIDINTINIPELCELANLTAE